MNITNSNSFTRKIRKVCFITMDISLKGGIERVICNLSRQFVEDYQVEVISIFKSNSVLQYTVDPRVKVTFLSDYEFNYNTYKFLLVKILWKSRSLFKQSEYHKFIGLYPIINIFLISVLRLKGERLIAAEHSEYFSQSWLLRKLRIVAYRQITHVIVLTKAGKICFQNEGIAAHVIPNAVTEFNDELQWKLRSIHNEKLSCLFAGRFEPVKQVEHIVNVAESLLKKRIENIEFNVLGEGPLYSTVKKMVKQRKLTNLNLWGNVPNIQDYYKENQLLIVPSSTEAFPMVVLEAMSFGCAIIAYDSQVGTSEIVENNKSGFIVSNNDIDGILQSILLLKADPNMLAELCANALMRSHNFKSDMVYQYWKKIIN